VPARAAADEWQDFQLARNAYDAQNYPLAVQRFERLIGGAIANRPVRLESRKYLAAAYMFVGRRETAERQLELLVREDPDAEMDPVAFPMDVLDLFTTVRTRLRSELQQAERARERAQRERTQRDTAARERERRRLARLVELAEEQRVERQGSRLVATVPFGVGQFQNGHDALGIAFAVSEGLLIATATTTFLIHSTLPRPSDMEDKPPSDLAGFRFTESALRITNLISIGVFVAVAITGIVDAHLRFRESEVIVRRRLLPPQLRNPAGASRSPERVSLRADGLSITF